MPIKNSRVTQSLLINFCSHFLCCFAFSFSGGDDTNYGFVLSNSKNMFQTWHIKSWTSGNDSDNFEPVVNDNLVLCHVLLQKVESPKIEKNNIFKRLLLYFLSEWLDLSPLLP